MWNIQKIWNAQKAFGTLLNTTNPVHTGTCEASGAITMVSAGRTYIELRPDLDYTTIIGLGKPTQVTRGVYKGYSLPIYAADNEELFGTVCVPGRYDEASDVSVHMYCWLAGAEDSKNFKLQLSWEHYTPGTDVVPATSNDVEVQTATGAGAAQFQSYEVAFTIDYDIDTPDDLIRDDIIGLRLRRIAADADECANEIVINHYGVIFRRDKMGTPTP